MISITYSIRNQARPHKHVRKYERRRRNKNSGNHKHKGVKGQVGGSAPSAKKGIPRTTKFERKENSIELTSDVRARVRERNEGAVIKAGKITNVKVFAGKGSKKILDKASLLVESFPETKPEDWSHSMGFGKIVMKGNQEANAEIHWFEHPQIGQIGWKIKTWDMIQKKEKK